MLVFEKYVKAVGVLLVVVSELTDRPPSPPFVLKYAERKGVKYISGMADKPISFLQMTHLQYGTKI